MIKGWWARYFHCSSVGLYPWETTLHEFLQTELFSWAAALHKLLQHVSLAQGQSCRRRLLQPCSSRTNRARRLVPLQPPLQMAAVELPQDQEAEIKIQQSIQGSGERWVMEHTEDVV